jgi:SAM-dependent methyltransferase
MLEPGSGSGELAAHLEQLTLDVVRIDRSLPALLDMPGTRPCLAADLLELPVRARAAGGVVLANVMRHLAPPQRARAAAEAGRVLVAGGLCIVLEDDPAARTPQERNYRRALDLLARADPTRGAALHASTLRDSFADALGDPIAVGKGDNLITARDPLAPVRWLEARAQLPFARAELARLRRAIEQDGIAYGRFWFQVYRREDV